MASCNHYKLQGIFLKNSQQCFETANFDDFCQELKNDLELRIPDKFLRAKGWL